MKSKSPKLIQLVNLIYELVQVSVLMWLRLLKMGVVYGWLESCYCGYFNMSSYSQDLRFKERLKSHLNLKYQRLLSLVFSTLVAGTICFSWFQQRINSNISLILIVFGLLVQLFMIYLVWLSFLGTTENQTDVLYAKALDLMVRRFVTSLGIWFLLIFSMLVAYANLVLFILVVPGAFCKLSSKFLTSHVVVVEQL